MGKSIFQAGDYLFNMEHIAAIIPTKTEKGEERVEVFFAGREGMTLVLCNEEAKAFLEALRANARLL